MAARIARHQPISAIFSELRALDDCKKGDVRGQGGESIPGIAESFLAFSIDRKRSSHRQDQKASKENHRGEIAIKCQMSKGPKTDAPQKRMAGNTLDTLGRFALSQENATSNGRLDSAM